MTASPNKPESCCTCPVCGNFKGPYQELCDGCEEWKENADSLRRAKIRRRTFGDVL
jgi:hypothetical protein